jgi:hypothetical protein
VVTDPLPLEATLVNADVSQGTVNTLPNGSDGTVSWAVGQLKPGATATLKLRVKIMARGKDLITNTVTVQSAICDPNPANNSSTVTRRRSGP